MAVRVSGRERKRERERHRGEGEVEKAGIGSAGGGRERGEKSSLGILGTMGVCREKFWNFFRLFRESRENGYG